MWIYFVLRDRLLEHLATDEEGGGEDVHHQRYSAHPQVSEALSNLSDSFQFAICLQLMLYKAPGDLSKSFQFAICYMFAIDAKLK